MRARPFSVVPQFALLLLGIGLAAQLVWTVLLPRSAAQVENLPPPPSLAMLQVASFGEPIGFTKALLLYLQSFDDQPGVAAAFRKLDYPRMQTWLERTLQLDSKTQYPLFLASRIYGSVGDPAKRRSMFDFVYQQFLLDPNRRWESLAFATLMTRHQLDDLYQAHIYAQALQQYATAPEVPSWAKQMDIFMLEDMGLYQQAIDQLDALIHGTEPMDSHELNFLQERMDAIKTKLAAGK